MTELSNVSSAEALTCSHSEAAHLHAFFQLLAQGYLNQGDAQGMPLGQQLPIAAIHRREHDGMRTYEIGPTEIIEHHATKGDLTFPREDMGEAAKIVLQQIREAQDGEVDLSAIEGLLDAMDIYDLQPRTDDLTSLHLQLWTMDGGPLMGVRLQSMVASTWQLLDGGRTANLKFEQQGVRFHQPAVQKMNAMGETEEDQPEDIAAVARRILYIESHGGTFRYADVADRVFRSNLLMLDTNLPRILAAMAYALHIDGTNKISELTQLISEQNTLKMKDELVRKHGFYEHKMRQFLLALAWGMRPAKQWTGRRNAIDALLVVDKQGLPMLYTRQDEHLLADYLFTHSRLEKASPREAHYGQLERENGVYYLKLNLKVSISRR